MPARSDDAHLDRAVLLPTAETHPEGTVYLSSYDIVLLQAGYAVSDVTQISLTATPPLGEDNIFPMDLSLKTTVHRGRYVRAAAIGSVTGIAGFEEGALFLGRAGGVVQLCFEDPCRSSISMSSTLLLGGPALLMVSGAGLIWRVTDFLAFLLESATLVPLTREAGEYHGLAVAPGFRLPFETWSLDLAVYVATDRGAGPTALPILAFTYRFLP